ncbi:hypothetical protein [uncultured Propionivibrio sp.]|uniref:hypothetical protein n=1 Tax=uncultured Propionivibrio sp. TaxID=426737 RepID=UPI0029C0CF9A|nr:hypothetical protein [uncultured Propionivibrio sp.]
MMYSTTTSRRIIKAKVKKSRTTQRSVRTTPNTAPIRTDAPSLPRFSRKDAPAKKTSKHWYLSWKLFVPLVLCSSAAIAYAFVASSSDEDDRPSTTQAQPQTQTQRNWRKAEKEEPGQIRPMGYSGIHPRGSAGDSGPVSGMGGARPTGSVGIPGIGQTASPARKQANNGSDAETIEASFGENRKVTLPENVAGNCKLSQPGLKDLSSCLAQNGARAE